MLRQSFLFLSALALLAFVAGPALAVQYTITDLGTNYSGSLSSLSAAEDINNNGQVIGSTQVDGEVANAFVWENGTMTSLASVGGGDAYGISINDAGVVVGKSDGMAMIWNSTNGMSYLPGAPSMSQCVAINDNVNAKAVGNGTFSGQQSFIYDVVSNSLTELTTSLGSPLMTTVTDINDSNVLLGRMYLPSAGGFVTFKYDGTTVTDLSTLITGVSSATAINDNGWIVGGASSGAYLFNGTTSVDLGQLGGCGIEPTDVNNTGLVVGKSAFGFDPEIGEIPPKAILYDSSTATLSELHSLLNAADQATWSTLEYASAVNDAGQIVGRGQLSTGEYRAFLMTPVPEPSTVALTVMGLVGLLCYAWRKRK